MPDSSFFIKTFGCQMNIRDSEIMAQKLSENGYVETSVLDDAELIIINTCSVRGKAEQKVFSMLGSLRKNKLSNPALKICVAGCVAQQEGQKIVDRMGHVDLVIGTQHIYKLPELLEQLKTGRTAINLSDTYEIPQYIPKIQGSHTTELGPVEPARPFQFSRFVTIMQGCNNFCTYCVVPYTRGREVSRNTDDIIEEVAILVESGVREITLLGQNVNSYGSASTVANASVPYSFARLLADVSRVEGLKRLRFTTSHPKDISDELIDCFSTIPNLCPQIHLPVQSGSDRILKRMNRKYSVASYLEKIDRLQSARPGIAITTDMIIGFPGETDRDFQDTMDLLERVRYHGSFSFKYSDRPGTAASSYDEKLSETEKSRRLQIFQNRQDQISLERNREYIGQTLSILVETNVDGKLMGRSATNHIVHVAAGTGTIRPGSLVDAEIYHAGQHSLLGRLSE